MYLSRLILNPRSRQVRSEISNPYEMHRTLMRAFPERLPEAERVLFRLDADPRSGRLTLLVQSLMEPDWSWLAEPRPQSYLQPTGEPNPGVKSFQPQFDPGQRLVFRLRANPTVKRDGRRLGLLREEDQRAWLARKAAQGGFTVLSADLRTEGLEKGRIQRPADRSPIGQGESHRLSMLAVRFDGLLQVSDPARFLDTLQTGIGSGKGLGFGLLSLARA
jgi:CRISPR system Cascade subunit CasE